MNPETFWDFPEDEIPTGPEWAAKGKLFDDLMRFGRQALEDAIAAPEKVFHPRFPAVFASAPLDTQYLLYLSLTEWLLFDHAIDDEGGTMADLYHKRKKLLMPGLQKKILAVLRETAMDIFEVQACHPGKGMELRRVDGIETFNVVEISGSRQMKRSMLLACRLCLFDEVHRIAGGAYNFKPKHRPEIQKIIARLLAQGPRQGRFWREHFSVEMFGHWVEKHVRS